MNNIVGIVKDATPTHVDVLLASDGTVVRLPFALQPGETIRFSTTFTMDGLRMSMDRLRMSVEDSSRQVVPLEQRMKARRDFRSKMWKG